MWFRRILRRRDDRQDRQQGAVLIMVAASMVAFIGMAAFAVDLGWIYLQSTNVKKAAEASALAAVAHMPLEVPQAADTVIAPGIPANDAADAISAEHGYTALGTTVKRWANPAQVRVDISSSTNTFFLQFFGIDTISLNRHAIAEQLPPLKLGGDTTLLGTRYRNNGTLVNDLQYWLGVNGEERRKADGDPFSTRCDSNGCSGTQNPQHQVPSYYYAVDVSAADVLANSVIRVRVYDGSNDSGGFDYTDDLSSGGNDRFKFRLLPPDATPGDPTDNFVNAGGSSGIICQRTFDNNDGSDVWRRICAGQPSFVPTAQGIHVLELIVAGDDTAINGYSLRITGGDANTTLYGLGFLSLWMRDAGSSPTLQVVRLDEIYAGTQLVISAFDLGDISGSGAAGNVTFGTALSGIDCQVRELNTDNLNPTAWRADDGGGSSCMLITKAGGGGTAGIYNNKWVEFKFDIPANYTCSGSGCWAKVTYNFTGGNPTDRTTWGARINGTPIHLLNETTPSS